MEMLKNKNVSEQLVNELKRFETEDEPILFAVVGDLSLNSTYCETVLAVTKSRTIVIDSSLEKGAAVSGGGTGKQRGHKLKIPLDIPRTCAILVKYANEQLDYEQLES
jgi:hypothetical protein